MTYEDWVEDWVFEDLPEALRLLGWMHVGTVTEIDAYYPVGSQLFGRHPSERIKHGDELLALETVVDVDRRRLWVEPHQLPGAARLVVGYMLLPVAGGRVPDHQKYQMAVEGRVAYNTWSALVYNVRDVVDVLDALRGLRHPIRPPQLGGSDDL